MTGDFSLAKIDPKKYPIFSNIKTRIIQFERYLRTKKFDRIASNYESSIDLCEKLRTIAIKKDDEYCANVAYILKTNISLIRNIAQFWELCENNEYPTAWTHLQNSLDLCETLLKFCDAETSESFIVIHKYLSLIEKLFPYTVFCSTEIGDIVAKCSICGKNTFDPECTHIAGNLYWGAVANNVVISLKSLDGIALVPNPADKRCIIHIDYDKESPEKSRFKHVYSFIKKSKRPLSNLKFRKSEREIPRSKFTHELKQWPCPCGSGMLFEECCFDKDIIKVPHIEIFYDRE
jgi:hypothetical protein